MSDDTWTRVDRYLAGQLLPDDPILSAALQASDAAGLPAISVSPTQGKLLQMLARLCGARNLLEIGTLGGYSTIWLARALPAGGRLVTLEADEKHAAVARANITRAGLDDRIEIRLGAALDTLQSLAAESRPPFDLTFIDADKVNTPAYFTWALQMSRPGSLIIVDNVVRNGAVADASTSDESVQGMRRFFDLLKREPRVSATAVQTVGAKGYDGFAVVMVGAAG
ncbi:MAG: O-methyltransferase [Acidobacteriota bacterium]|nr:O-methyltransferase [Acidobacteriota bacterium]